MELIKIQKKYQITLPKALREFYSLKVGDHISIEKKDGAISLVPISIIPKDQRYFYTPDWQKMEAEADEDIEEGNMIGPFDNENDAISALKE